MKKIISLLAVMVVASSFGALIQIEDTDTTLKAWRDIINSNSAQTVYQQFDLVFNDVFATEGLEANIYFDNLIAGDWQDYSWGVVCDVGTQQNERFTYTPAFATDSTNVITTAISPAHTQSSTDDIEGYGCLSTWSNNFNQVVWPIIGNRSNQWNEIVCEVRSVTYAGTEGQDIANSTLIYGVTNSLDAPTSTLYTNVTFDLPGTVIASQVDDALLCIFRCQTNGTPVGQSGRTSGTMPSRLTAKNGAYYYNGSLTASASSTYYSMYALNFISSSAVSTTNAITINCYNKETRALIDSASGNIYTTAEGYGLGAANILMMIGDSTTAHNSYPRYVWDNGNADVVDFTMVGTQPNIYDTNAVHEGYAGMTVGWFCTSTNSPFSYSGAFNFAQYLADNSITTPTHIIINLGINSLFARTSPADVLAKFNSNKLYYDEIIASVHSVDSSIKIGVGITQPPSYYQDSFGDDYGAGYERDQFKHNVIYYGELLAGEYEDREGESIYVVPVNQYLDTVNNMHTTEVAINARNTNTVFRQSNGVHPATTGYQQLADGVWAWIKATN